MSRRGAVESFFDWVWLAWFVRCLLQENWRKEVAKDIQLLRRTGPYQLALLSHLRRDDAILPVLKAVWHQALHSSCPSLEKEEAEVRKAHWRPVAESLLKESKLHAEGEALRSQHHSCELPALLMPGSAAVMQVFFPQLEGRGIREEDFLTVVLDQSVRVTAVLHRCLPEALWEALTAVGKAALADGEVGLLGEDVIIEIATRACSIVHEWPGRVVFQSVQLHLRTLIEALLASLPRAVPFDVPAKQPHGGEDEVRRAVAPAVAAFLLQPIVEQVAALQLQFPSTRGWQSFLGPLVSPFPAATWQTIREISIGAAFQLHVADLEQSIHSKTSDDMQDPDVVRVFSLCHGLQRTQLEAHCGAQTTELFAYFG